MIYALKNYFESFALMSNNYIIVLALLGLIFSFLGAMSSYTCCRIILIYLTIGITGVAYSQDIGLKQNSAIQSVIVYDATKIQHGYPDWQKKIAALDVAEQKFKQT